MTTDTKALRALLDACVPGEWAASPSEHDLNLALRDAAPDLIDAHDERAALCAERHVLRAEVARLRGALQLVQRMNKEALPKFDWAASFLDANAIDLLNRAQMAVDAALTGATK